MAGGLLQRLVVLRRARRLVSAGPVLGVCLAGACLLPGLPPVVAFLAGLPFLAAFLACQIVLFGACEPPLPMAGEQGMTAGIFGKILWGLMAAAGAWLFLPGAPDTLSASFWLAFTAALVLAALFLIRRRLVWLRGDHISVIMWKGVLPTTLAWLLVASVFSGVMR